MSNACAVLLAAGSARRMEADRNKVLLKFDDQSAVIRCLKTLRDTGLFSSYVVVCRPEERSLIERKVSEHMNGTQCLFCSGGSERQYSVRNALRIVPDGTDLIAVHDAARCFVTPDVIEETVKCAEKYGSGVAALRATDTIKRVTGDIIEETLDRSELVCVQTPQTFRADILRLAYEKADRDGYLGTDDASIVERLGVPVHICTGSPDNIKLTVRQDIEKGEQILERRREEDRTCVGFGFDVHRLVHGRRLVLGGVEIPSDIGLDGHSDADVVIHAVMDAILGAAGMPDIGQLYPDCDPEFEGISSLVLLADTGKRIREAGYSVSNIDVTVLAEYPKVAPFKKRMTANIADSLGILPEKINIKATTLEKLGPLGQGEGIAAQAVCLVRKRAARA